MERVFYVVLTVAIIVLVFRFGEAFGRMSMEVLW